MGGGGRRRGCTRERGKGSYFRYPKPSDPDDEARNDAAGADRGRPRTTGSWRHRCDARDASPAAPRYLTDSGRPYMPLGTLPPPHAAGHLTDAHATSARTRRVRMKRRKLAQLFPEVAKSPRTRWGFRRMTPAATAQDPRPPMRAAGIRARQGNAGQECHDAPTAQPEQPPNKQQKNSEKTRGRSKKHQKTIKKHQKNSKKPKKKASGEKMTPPP